MLTDERIAQIASTPCAVRGSYVHTFARAIEAETQAATFATVTPLVQQMLDALVAAYPELNGLAVMSDTALGLAKQHAKATTAARAFLSGATKGEPS